MGEASGRNNTLFQMAVSLGHGAETKATLLEEVELANKLFADPLPAPEVHAVVNSVWGYKESSTLLVRGQPSTLIRKEAHSRLLGNCDAIGLFSDLMHNHSWRKGGEFILANITRKRLGLSQARFVAAVKHLEASGLLRITKSGGKGPGSVRMAKLLSR